jgi:hypothetical protein
MKKITTKADFTQESASFYLNKLIQYGCLNEKVRFSNTNNKLINEVGYVNEKTKETK